MMHSFSCRGGGRLQCLIPDQISGARVCTWDPPTHTYTTASRPCKEGLSGPPQCILASCDVHLLRNPTHTLCHPNSHTHACQPAPWGDDSPKALGTNCSTGSVELSDTSGGRRCCTKKSPTSLWCSGHPIRAMRGRGGVRCSGL